MIDDTTPSKFVAATVAKPFPCFEAANYTRWVMNPAIFARMHRKLKRRLVWSCIIFIKSLFEIQFHSSRCVVNRCRIQPIIASGIPHLSKLSTIRLSLRPISCRL